MWQNLCLILYTGWRGADLHNSNLNIAPVRQLVMVGGKGNAISYGQSQWRVGTCNNVLPVFVVITKRSLTEVQRVFR